MVRFGINKHVGTRHWLVLLMLALAVPASALANPRPFPFTYTHPVQPPGAFEVELYTDLSPVEVRRQTDNGSEAVTSLRAELQAELELGLTEGLDFGWYFVFRQAASAGGAAMEFKGVKQRLKLQLAPPSAWAVDVALYLEVAEFNDEIELEQKVILSRRLGAWQLALNLWVEQEYYYQDGVWKFLYHPTVAAGYELSPVVSLGLEYWVRGRFDNVDGAARAPVHYVGPTLLVSSPGPWFSMGAYVRADRLAEAPAVDDPDGRFWFRAIVGFDI